jgi:hypothetical protein
MTTEREKVAADFRRMMKLIVVIGVVFTIGPSVFLGREW